MAKRILIIDDDIHICQYLETLLIRKGYEAQSFTDVGQGVQVLAKDSCDLIFLDVRLSGISGLNVCRNLRHNNKTSHIPIIIMTAYFKKAGNKERAQKEYGATDYLTKPFSTEALLQMVHEHIGAASIESVAKQPIVAYQGELHDVPVARQLHNLYSLKATGLLHLQRDNIEKIIYFKDGYAIFARSNLLRECLGQRLVQSRLINQKQCDETLSVSRERGALHGTALIDAGLLTPHQLHEALHDQVIHKLLDTFSWKSGHYRFIHGQDFKKGLTAIHESPAGLILRGILTYYDVDRVDEFLSPVLDLFPVLSDNPHYRFQEISLTPVQKKLVKNCKGQQTLRAIVEDCPVTVGERKRLMAALIIAQMIHLVPDAVAIVDDVPDDPASSDELQKREQFLSEYNRLINLDHFSLLNVGKDCSDTELRKAYFSMVKKHHPDRFFHYQNSVDIKEKVDALFQKINAAHSVLADSEMRKHYLQDQAMRAGGTGTFEEEDTAMAAEISFQKGLILAQNSHFAEAAPLLKTAADKSPRECEYLSWSAWAEFRISPAGEGDCLKARKRLQKALEIDPSFDKAHLFMGYVWRASQAERKALREFGKAVECNPNCLEALRELRLYRMRAEQQQKKSKSVLGKMLGKK